MTKYLLIFSFLSLLIVHKTQAQNINSQTQLANQYFENKEFDKAETVYKELYESTKADYYFNYYVTCLAEQKKYSEAEREIKREIRRNRDGLNFYADLAYLYKEQGDAKKAEETINEAIDKLSSQKHEIFKLANALIRRQEYDHAAVVYEKAEDILGRSFNRELANVYSIQRKYPEMINKYMDWAEEDIKNISSVETRLQYFVDRDHDNSFSEIMRTELLKRIQQRNSSVTNNKMLFWLYMQKKDFRQALVQAMAIDRRIMSSGRPIMELAEAAKNSKDYTTAKDAYEYIVGKGENHLFHIDATLGQLDVLFLQIEDGVITDKEKIKETEQQYAQAIEKFGFGENTIEAIINLSVIQAFYLDMPQKADEHLQRAVNVRGLSSQLVGRCKIARADILVLQDNLWEAALIYAQAESENKDHPVGDEAKLKKAFLAYYGHQFEWALAQFDALKKSTSKTVANDALKYAIFIEENLKTDSLHRALNYYSRADLLHFRLEHRKALATLDSLIEQFPTDPIKVHAYFKLAEIHEELQEYQDAQKFYKKIIAEFSHTSLKPKALFRLGVLYEDQLNNNEEALEYYKKLIMEHPESIHTNAASKRLRAIRDNEKNKNAPL